MYFYGWYKNVDSRIFNSAEFYMISTSAVLSASLQVQALYTADKRMKPESTQWDTEASFRKIQQSNLCVSRCGVTLLTAGPARPCQ